MSTNPSPAEIVQTLYAAFGRGDIAAIIAHVSDDVDWRLNVDQSSPGAKDVPDFKPFRGRAGVQEFFQTVGGALEFHSFEPQSFMSNDREVAARVVMELSVRKTGRRVRLESMHYFVFDATGRVTRFVEFLDTLATAAAWDAVRAKN